jgi:hypothetical protein
MKKMKNLMKTFIVVIIAFTCFTNTKAQANKTININNTMPNRISMNATVGKQNMMVAIIDGGCVITLPPYKAFRVNTATNTMTEISQAESNKLIAEGKQTNATTFGERVNPSSTVVSSGAGMLGGAMPGGSILSAEISGVASAAAAATSGRKASWDLKTNETRLQLPNDLPDGEYELIVVIAHSKGGLKDTLKTQVRMAFTLTQGILKTKHDTAKNSISNIR